MLMAAKELDHSYITGGNVKCFKHSARQLVSFIKTENEFTV